MNLAAKQHFIDMFDVSRETIEQIEIFIDLLRAENAVQNLVSKTSLEDVWNRHVLDSAQLLDLAPSSDGKWIDLGTGGGFPGLVIALLHPGPVTLVEERTKRADFLRRAIETLGIAHKTCVKATKAERMTPEPFAIISARAFAPLDRLFRIGSRFSTEKTRWILPKGRNAYYELAMAQSSWQGAFRVETSITDPAAGIIVAERVTARGKPGIGGAGRR